MRLAACLLALAASAHSMALTVRVCQGAQCRKRLKAVRKKDPEFVDLGQALQGVSGVSVEGSMAASTSASGCLGSCERGPNALAVDDDGEPVALDGLCLTTGTSTLFGLGSAERVAEVVERAAAWAAR